MLRQLVYPVFLVWLLQLMLPAGATADEPSNAERLFALKVQPLFRSKCLACHGEKPDEIEGGFDIRTRESVLKGGESFEHNVLIPGKSAESILYSVVRRTETGYSMPPKEAEKLSEEETWFIRDWIDGGAPWPDEQRVADIYKRFAAGVAVKTSGGLSAEWTDRKYRPEDLWAWQPIGDFSKDVQRKEDTTTHPIDVFINQRLADADIPPAPLADRRTFIRRATFDLWGLPPAPGEVAAFVKDPAEDDRAIASLINRLLHSTHYGEQWGRHWLDVVRYADSSGFANDWERPNAWRYRDYVIRAFNQDRPYDQFVREQLAGDEIDPQNPENLIAAGFLRMGPWEQTGMSVAKVTRQLFLDDITDSVGQVFLANALQCCRCHDHKFDPIPTHDYYSFQAIFATTQFVERDADWLPNENRSGIAEDRKYHQLQQKANNELGQRLKQRVAENEKDWFKQQGLPYTSRSEAEQANAPSEHLPPKNLRVTPADYGQERIFRKWQTRFSWEKDRFQPIAFTVYSGKTPKLNNVTSRIEKPTNDKAGRLEQTAILTGGSLFSAADKVQPAVLSAVPGALEVQIPTDVAGRRTALADWIVSQDNTLTSRVMVNRIWHYHFGRGIAANPNNFGTTGKKPTHPKLLDWLAGEFMARKWSVKQMHRLIMTSHAYRRSTEHPDAEQLADKDSDHHLYAAFVPRRLEAEELRDAMLAVSGELNPEAGGVPIRPDMNMEAALQPRMIMGTFAPSYVPNPTPAQRNRRSVYALRLRGHRDPMMETFNQPGSDKSCEMRDTSTIAPQALTLLNSEETADRALAFADRIVKNTQSDAAAIQRVFQQAYGRNPDDEEAADALQFWQQMTKVEKPITYAPRKYPSDVIRNAIEENTGKPFSFSERLMAYDDYVHDLQPHEVAAKVRGLADLCLAVFNSNEFVFVY